MRFPVQLDIQRSFVFTEPIDVVWEGTIHYLSSNEIPIKTQDRDSGIVNAETTHRISRDDDEFAECPTNGVDLFGDWDRHMKVHIIASMDESDTTTVTINLEFSRVYYSAGFFRELGERTTLDCVSTGKGEQTIYESIKKYVADQTGEVDSQEQ